MPYYPNGEKVLHCIQVKYLVFSIYVCCPSSSRCVALWRACLFPPNLLLYTKESKECQVKGDLLLVKTDLGSDKFPSGSIGGTEGLCCALRWGLEPVGTGTRQPGPLLTQTRLPALCPEDTVQRHTSQSSAVGQGGCSVPFLQVKHWYRKACGTWCSEPTASDHTESSHVLGHLLAQSQAMSVYEFSRRNVMFCKMRDRIHLVITITSLNPKELKSNTYGWEKTWVKEQTQKH